MFPNLELNAVEQAILKAIEKDLKKGNFKDVETEIDHLKPSLGSDFAYALAKILLSASSAAPNHK
ncbi:hypothetical protein IJG76_00110 [Candidatus Saccharibacteria bacterium]|nr:hypothetical protein [Candidatus Saccharibacteria bacterium]